MAIIEQEQILHIKVNRLDMRLVHLLESRYDLIISQNNESIDLQLYDKYV